MAELGGNLMYLKISNALMTAPNDGVRINGVDKATFKRASETLEITSFGDTYKRKVAGIKDTDLKLSGNLDLDDAGQLDLEPGAIVYVALYPQGLSKPGKQICMIVEDFEQSADVGGKQDFSCQLAGNGAPTVIGVV